MRSLVQKEMYMRANKGKTEDLFVLELVGNIDFSGKAIKEQENKTRMQCFLCFPLSFFFFYSFFIFN